ncbi:MAG: OmpA family protein [Lewinella sp.]|nr:OmpA family protein [Lewinella sp.]
MYRSLPLLAVFALVLFLPAFLSAQDKIDDFDEALSLWDQAHKLGDPASGNFLPDSAYSTILLSQRYWRKLNNGKKNKLERSHGISQESYTRFKNGLKEGSYSAALQSGKSAAVERFLETFKPIPPKLQMPAYQARNQFFLEEMHRKPAYSKIKAFYDKNKDNIARYNDDLVRDYEETLALAYFMEKDTTDVFVVLSFVKDHPDLLPVLDKYLAGAMPNASFMAFVESALKGMDTAKIPMTAREIFRKYAASGRKEDFNHFFGQFGEYMDSSWYNNELALLRQAPADEDILSGNNRAAWESYVKAAAPRYHAWEVLMRLLEPDLRSRNWAGALEQLERMGSCFGADHPWIANLTSMLKAPVHGLHPEPIGTHINTDLGEYSPVVAADGKELYFCRRENKIENIYKSQWTAKSGWSVPQGVQPFLHPLKNQAPLALSSDGTTLIVFEEARVKASMKSPIGWAKPQPLFGDLQASEWQGGTTLSPDGQAVIFAARRLDRVGFDLDDNIDLFLCLKQPDGQWGKPINLGTTINTPWTERSPFLHPDMRTLYFSSSGHGGFGGLDVFKTTRIGEGWLEWSEPVNLGKEINTTGGDWGYKVSTDGKTAYFSADADNGMEDLFQVDLPEEARPDAVTTIAGKLTGTDGTPITGEIEVEDLEAAKWIATIRPDPVTGEFFITLPKGKLYSYTVKAENRFPVSDNIDLREKTDARKITTDITAPTIEEMAGGEITLPLKNVFFDTAKDELKPESYPELDRMAGLILQLGLEATLNGHTDNVGGQDYNKDLSERRAKAVRNYLISKGIDPGMVKSEGFGYSKPVAENDTEDGRAQNRRVEIRLRKLQ